MKRKTGGLPDNESSYQGAEERPPESLEGEVVADLLQREEDAADRSPEGHGDAGGRRGREDLSLLGLVSAVLRKQVSLETEFSFNQKSWDN